MAERLTYLLPGKFYHIYSYKNGNELLFTAEADYVCFLKMYKEYISPVADTYAYCLLPGHFHFLIRLKPEEAIFDFLKQDNKLPEASITLEEFQLLFKGNNAVNLFSLHVNRQFSHFFNSYSQSLNKAGIRKENTLMRTFKRKEIISPGYLKQLILYIHSNPVHHGFVQKMTDWKYLSYHSIVSELATHLKRKEVIDFFEDIANFKISHEQVNRNLLTEMEAGLN